tara:strand:- start:453 stop:737 length:285 start_codon:yes stop_codon:yes gene_type:complete
MSYLFYKILNLDLCILIDNYIKYKNNYNKTLIELINLFDKSKKLIKQHNVSIIERDCQKYNKLYYLKPEFINYIRERNNILLIYRLIINNYLNQ